MGRAGLRGGVIPSLLVRDLTETLAFYERIGFEAVGWYPDRTNPSWAEVRRGDVVIQLHTGAPHGTPPGPIFSGTLYMTAETVDRLADELRDHVAFAWGPEVMDYGMKEFAVQDPNGYYLAFTEPA